METIDESVLLNIRDSVKCTVCVSVLHRPCTLTCGHNFCKQCINGESQGICPNCRTAYIKPVDYNHDLDNVIKTLFPAEYSERESETEKETKDGKERDDLYASIYREMAEQARRNHAAAPSGFDRFAEALAGLRNNPVQIMDYMILYNYVVIVCGFTIALMNVLDATDVSSGVALCLTFMSFLFNRYTPMFVNWIKYGEGVFRAANSQSTSPQQNSRTGINNTRNSINQLLDLLSMNSSSIAGISVGPVNPQMQQFSNSPSTRGNNNDSVQMMPAYSVMYSPRGSVAEINRQPAIADSRPVSESSESISDDMPELEHDDIMHE